MKQKKLYSWNIIAKNCIQKEIDKTFINDGITGIPHKLVNFFDLNNYEDIQFKYFIYNANVYKIKFEIYGKAKNRVRMILNKSFYEIKNSIKIYKKMSIIKINRDEYLINFFDNGIDEVTFDDLTSFDQISEKEGKKIIIYSTKYERNKSLRNKAIKIHGCKCQICGFDFEKFYGIIGKDFIEVHHIKPLNTFSNEMLVNPQKDLICVCSNCHRMLHRNRTNTILPEELRNMIEKERKK